MSRVASAPSVAIACGGTGGHLFPGMAVGQALRECGTRVTLLISPKEVDREAVRSVKGMRVVSLAAVGWDGRRPWRFVAGLREALRETRHGFAEERPDAVLAMGGFTSVAPVGLGRRMGAKTFLHDSNAVPGRANRWLAPWVDAVFLGFGCAARRLRTRRTLVTGTPVRAKLRNLDAAECRRALGLDPSRPVLLVTGGSQGARGVNRLVLQALPALRQIEPGLQFLHLSGHAECDEVRRAHEQAGTSALVLPFLSDMELAMGAATVAISRAGGSSLAELAAVRLPAVLIPYPAAVDNHQWYNAGEYVATGAALMLEEGEGAAGRLVERVRDLLQRGGCGEAMRTALARWDVPGAADRIAKVVLEAMQGGWSAWAETQVGPASGVGSGWTGVARLAGQAEERGGVR